MASQNSIFRQLCWWYICFKKVVLHKDSYLHTSGWINSLQTGHPTDANGNALPWMNYSAISLLENRLKNTHRLFEYGSGFSTQFFAKRVAFVRSVEYDEKWFKRVSRNLPCNVEILFREKDVDGKYCRAITELGERYDVVVVDGRDRVNCVKQSLECLTEQGVIILDDAERDYYQAALSYAKEQEFRALTFEGLKPNKIRLSKSVLLYRENNCFGI